MKTRDYILDQLVVTSKTFNQLQAQLHWLSYDSLRGAINRLLKAGTIISYKTNDERFYAKDLLQFPNAPKVPPMPKMAKAVKLTAPSKPKARPRLTKVILVLDNSGSMQTIAHSALKSFNQTLKDLKDSAIRTDEKTVVSLYLFGTEIKQYHDQVDIHKIASMVYYNPNEGGTRLFDAVGQAINDHKFADAQGLDVSYLVIVITDGAENRSTSFNEFRLNALIAEIQGTDKWTITFQLPKYQKADFCRRFNIPDGNVMEWEQTEAGVRESTTARSAGVGNYFAARSLGASKVSNFYTVNANDIKVKDLKRELTNVAWQTRSWNVEHEVEIKPFVEIHLAVYTPGTVFYQLSKTEEVQSYKKILVQKKFTKEIYAGDEARELLGLPVGTTCKVKVGNLGDYDVFIQSTSVNRKLVRGTRVIYFAGAVN